MSKKDLFTDPQILKFDRKASFLEVTADALRIGQIKLAFRTYDMQKESGNRMTAEIDIYMPMAEMMALNHNILSGRLNYEIKKSLEAAQAAGSKYPKEVYTKMGGTSAVRLTAQGKARPDGKSISRQLKISPGSVAPFLFSAESGPGEEDDKGLIVPKYVGNKPEQRILIPMTEDDMKQLALMTNSFMDAFNALRLNSMLQSLEEAASARRA